MAGKNSLSICDMSPVVCPIFDIFLFNGLRQEGGKYEVKSLWLFRMNLFAVFSLVSFVVSISAGEIYILVGILVGRIVRLLAR